MTTEVTPIDSRPHSFGSLVDSHCHLDSFGGDEEVDAQLTAARALGVSIWIVPGVAPEGFPKLRSLAKKYPACVYFTAGLHPYHAASFDAVLSPAALAQAISSEGAVGIGEIGLDAACGVPMAEQVVAFEAQLELARTSRCPLVLHQVRAQEQFLRCLARVGISEAGAAVHAFGGDLAWARALLRRGVRYFGVGLGLLDPKRAKLRKAALELGVDRLLVETDAPFGAGKVLPRPVPPKALASVLCGLSELLQLDAERVGRTTAENAKEFFRLPRDIAERTP